MVQISGSIFSVINTLSSSVVSAAIKAADHTFSLDLNFVRGVVTLIITYIILKIQEKKAIIEVKLVEKIILELILEPK